MEPVQLRPRSCRLSHGAAASRSMPPWRGSPPCVAEQLLRETTSCRKRDMLCSSSELARSPRGK
eukprot:15295580-Alexandrium_andersonii.AAC.1